MYLHHSSTQALVLLFRRCALRFQLAQKIACVSGELTKDQSPGDLLYTPQQHFGGNQEPVRHEYASPKYRFAKSTPDCIKLFCSRLTICVARNEWHRRRSSGRWIDGGTHALLSPAHPSSQPEQPGIPLVFASFSSSRSFFYF